MYRLRRPLSLPDVRRLMWELLVAVRYLHSQQVWHRYGAALHYITLGTSATESWSEVCSIRSEACCDYESYGAQAEFSACCAKPSTLRNS